jgi:hypothetical protein
MPNVSAELTTAAPAARRRTWSQVEEHSQTHSTFTIRAPNGRNHIPRGAEPGARRRDGAGPRRLPDGRGGRGLQRRVQGLQGAARPLRRDAGRRHADHRARLRGPRRRRGDDRAAAGHRVHDLELRDPRVRPDLQLGREDALDERRPVQDPGHLPRPDRARRCSSRRSTRRRWRRGRPLPRAQGGGARHAGGREGAAQGLHPRRRPGLRLRGRDALQPQGRGPGGRRLRHPARRGGPEARGRATSRSSRTAR